MAIDFAPGTSDLPAQAEDKVTQMAHQSLAGTTTFEVAAHAPAIGGDASAARRLSLARALAARAALVAAGVPGSRIYVRALGAPPASQADTADRATITVNGLGGGDIASPQAAASNQGKPP